MTHPRTALTQGEDEIGRFQVLAISGVSQIFRLIPAGTFLMGSPADELGRLEGEEQHEEAVSAFWLADTPVTQALYYAVTGGAPSLFTGSNLPVETVSWKDAQMFIGKLSGLVPGLGLRLPSEGEYACRAGSTTAYSFGGFDEHCPPFESVRFNSKSTVGVKARPANAWGLHQMHGNVWEWCEDHDEDFLCRCVRGGSWTSSWTCTRSASRHWFSPSFSHRGIGFRVACTLAP